MATTCGEEAPDTCQLLDDHFRNYTLREPKMIKIINGQGRGIQTLLSLYCIFRRRRHWLCVEASGLGLGVCLVTVAG